MQYNRSHTNSQHDLLISDCTVTPQHLLPLALVTAHQGAPPPPRRTKQLFFMTKTVFYDSLLHRCHFHGFDLAGHGYMGTDVDQNQ